MWDILDIVRDKIEDEVPECIDLNLLSHKTARRIESFVDSKMSQTTFKKKIKAINDANKITTVKPLDAQPQQKKYQEITMNDFDFDKKFSESPCSLSQVDPCAKTMGPSIKPIDETESSFLSDLDDSF